MGTVNAEQQINSFFNRVIDTLNRFNRQDLQNVIDRIITTYLEDGIIYVFGNGGSASTASHFCGDFIKGVSFGLEKRFKIICLNDNMAALMAIANDISYDYIFVEQLKNFLTARDMVIGISCSGNSLNVIKAIEYAKSVGALTVAFCGFDGGALKMSADLSLHAEIDDMEICEDVHLVIIHCVKQILLKMLHN